MRHEVAVQAGQGVTAAPKVHLRQVPDRPAGADKRLSAGERRHVSVRQGGPQVAAERTDLGRLRWIAAKEAVCESQGAEREGPGVLGCTVPEAYELQGATTDVQAQAVCHVDAVDGSGEPEVSLAVAVHDLDWNTKALSDQFGEHLPVLRLAHGKGADRADLAGALTSGERDEVCNRFDRSLEPQVGQATIVIQGTGQEKRSSQLVDHLERAALADLQDDHASGVRTDVDDGHALAEHGAHSHTIRPRGRGGKVEFTDGRRRDGEQRSSYLSARYSA